MSKMIESLYAAYKIWRDQHEKRFRFLTWREHYLASICPCHLCERIR